MVANKYINFTDNQFNLATKANSLSIQVKPIRPPMRSSIEGLNQEIEGLVLKSTTSSSDSDHTIDDKVHLLKFCGD